MPSEGYRDFGTRNGIGNLDFGMRNGISLMILVQRTVSSRDPSINMINQVSQKKVPTFGNS